MENKKQLTAVEWLEEQIYLYGINPHQSLFEQAKEMEKQNTISFGYSCVAEVEVKKGNLIYNKVPEEIYNETFKSE
jgi:hypothetical protein